MTRVPGVRELFVRSSANFYKLPANLLAAYDDFLLSTLVSKIKEINYVLSNQAVLPQNLQQKMHFKPQHFSNYLHFSLYFAILKYGRLNNVYPTIITFPSPTAHHELVLLLSPQKDSASKHRPHINPRNMVTLSPGDLTGIQGNCQCVQIRGACGGLGLRPRFFFSLWTNLFWPSIKALNYG